MGWERGCRVVATLTQILAFCLLPLPRNLCILCSKTQQFAALKRVRLQQRQSVGWLPCQSAAIICCQADFPEVPFTQHCRYRSLPAPGFGEDTAVLSEDPVSAALMPPWWELACKQLACNAELLSVGDSSFVSPSLYLSLSQHWVGGASLLTTLFIDY